LATQTNGGIVANLNSSPTSKLEESDLIIGAKLKAKWDGAFSEITKIEGDKVHYKGISYSGSWIDSIRDMIKHFELVEQQTEEK